MIFGPQLLSLSIILQDSSMLQHATVLSFFFLSYFLAVLGLHCCTQAFSSCNEWGLLFIVACGLLIAVASLVGEHKLQAVGLQQLWHMVQLLQGMWDLPGSGIEPMPCALTGRCLTTGPPGKPSFIPFCYLIIFYCSFLSGMPSSSNNFPYRD